MPGTTTYKGLTILDASPVGAGGDLVQDNFVYIADALEDLELGGGGGGQPLDATLTALAGLTIADNAIIVGTGTDTFETVILSANVYSLLGAADYSAIRTQLGLVIGTNIQAQDAELSAIAGLTSAANKGILFTGSGTASTFDLTAAALTVLDDSTVAAMLVTMGGAPLASPTFTGTPAAPTASGGTNTTQIATTAFVTSAVAAGGGAPFADTTAIVKGSADATKQVRFEVDGLTGSTTRIITVPDFDLTLVPKADPSFTGIVSAETINIASDTILLDETQAVFDIGAVFNNGITMDEEFVCNGGSFTVSPTIVSTSLPVLFEGASVITNLTTGTLYFSSLKDFEDAGAVITIDGLTGNITTVGLVTIPTATPGTNTTQAATTAFVTAAVSTAVTGLLDFKGSTDASGNPNYPSALKGDSYIVSVAGKIGGASGKSVDVGDVYFATADNAGGTEASVGTSWVVLEHNLAGALLSANNLSDVANTTTARSNLGLVIGTNVQAYDAELAAIAGLTSAANKGIVFTGSGTASTYDLTAAALTVLDDTTVGAMLATMGGAPLASPTFTGTPAAPTASGGTNTTQIATTAFVTSAVSTGTAGLLEFKGSTDASANPNYPSASQGDAYVVSVAGKVGGASGKVVAAGDVYLATADNAGGTEASVGTSWIVLEHNLLDALIATNNLSDLTNTTTARSNLGLGTVAVLASDTDTTLAADSNLRVATQKATKAYVDAAVIGGGGQPLDATLTALAGLTIVDNAIIVGTGTDAFETVTLSANAYSFLSAASYDAAGLVAKSGTQTGIAGDKTFTGIVTAAGLVESTTSLGTTSTDGLLVTNTTAATVGTTVQISPRIRLHGAAWKSSATAASQTHDWIIENLPQTGAASTTSVLRFGVSVNGGGYSYPIHLDSDGETVFNGSANLGGNSLVGADTVFASTLKIYDPTNDDYGPTIDADDDLVTLAGADLTITGGGLTVAGNIRNSSVTNLTDATNIATNSDLNNVFKVTIAGNRTIDNPTGTPIDGQNLTYRISRSGAFTITGWGAAFRFAGGIEPEQTAVSGKTDYIGFKWNATDSKWDCVAERLNFG